MERKFESAKKAKGNNILSNAFDFTKRIFVNTDASGEGFGHILMQKKSKSQYQMRTQATNGAGEKTRDTGWLVISVGSAALKPVWRY